MYRALVCSALLLLLLLPSLAVAQVAPQDFSCPSQLRNTEIEKNVLDMNLRQTRTMLANELRQALERAEKAEQALAKATSEAPPKPAETPQPPVPTQEGK